MTYVVAYLIVLAVFGVVDLLWLRAMADALYRPTLGDMLLAQIRPAPALAFYLMFPLGVLYFAVLPALRSDSAAAALISGALLGGFAYATYDLTNYATLKNWTLQITAIDIAYGAAVTGLAAAVAYFGARAVAHPCSSRRRPQPVMADAPLLAAGVAEQPGRREEEQPPAPLPERGVARRRPAAGSASIAVGVAVEIGQPVERGALIVRAAPAPVLPRPRSSRANCRIRPWLGMMPPVKKCWAIQSARSAASKR